MPGVRGHEFVVEGGAAGRVRHGSSGILVKPAILAGTSL